MLETEKKSSRLLTKISSLSLIISLFMFLVSLIYLPKAQPELPLFYTLDQTIGPLTNKWMLLILPGFAFIISLINLSITTKLKNTLSLLVLKLYTWANLVIVSLLLVALLRIIYVTF